MRVLVTGGTGFIGRRLVPPLVRHAERITLLVRPQSLAAARSRVESWKAASRVSLAIGDVTENQLGLAAEERDRLARSMTHVFHWAADYGPGVPR